MSLLDRVPGLCSPQPEGGKKVDPKSDNINKFFNCVFDFNISTGLTTNPPTLSVMG